MQTESPFAWGVRVRVLGFLLLLVAQSATAAEQPIRVAFARFAYANSSAFQTSLEQPSRDAVSNIERRLPRLPLAVLDQKPLVAQQPHAPLPSVKSVEAEPLAADVGFNVAAADPDTQQNHPVVRIETAQAEPDAVVAPALTSEPLAPEPPPAVQRFAALPEPMHLLPKPPAEEITATEVPPAVPEPRNDVARKRVKSRARPHQQAHTARPSSQKKNEPAAKPAKIPRWAGQMFDVTWQDRAFAYQR